MIPHLMPDNYNIEIVHSRSEAIEAFLRDHGSVFHSHEFLTAVGKDYHCVVVKREDGEIAGVLPLVKSRKRLLTAYHRPPYTYQFGPVTHNQIQKESHKIIHLLLKELPPSGHYDFKLYMDEEDIGIFKNAGFEVTAHRTHLLEKEMDYGLHALSETKRRDIRKLLEYEREGRIQCMENRASHLDLIEHLWQKTADRSRFATHLQIVRKIFSKGFRSYHNVILNGKEEAISASFCLMDAHTSYHLISASKRVSDNILNNANILSLYKSIKHAHSQGLDFDTEGSNIPGVAQFYQMMGGYPQAVYRAQRTPSLYYRLLRSIGGVIRQT